MFVDALGFRIVSRKNCNLLNLLGSFWILNDITFLRCGLCFSTSFTICLQMCEAVKFVFPLVFDFSFRILYTLCSFPSSFTCCSLCHFCTNCVVFLPLSTLLDNSLTHTAAILRRWELSFSELDMWISFSTSRGMTLFWWRKFNMAFHRFRKLTGRLSYVHLEASAGNMCLLNSVCPALWQIKLKFICLRHGILNVRTTDILKRTRWLEWDVEVTTSQLLYLLMMKKILLLYVCVSATTRGNYEII